MILDTAVLAAKSIGGLVASVGIGAVTKNIIKVTTPGNTGKIVKICINVGSYFIAGIASAAAANQMGETIDSVVNIAKKVIPSKKKKDSESEEQNETVSEETPEDVKKEEA
jgi:predicted TIM-barrel enzyme